MSEINHGETGSRLGETKGHRIGLAELDRTEFEDFRSAIAQCAGLEPEDTLLAWTVVQLEGGASDHGAEVERVGALLGDAAERRGGVYPAIGVGSATLSDAETGEVVGYSIVFFAERKGDGDTPDAFSSDTQLNSAALKLIFESPGLVIT